ncbi:hypothetical protein L0F63_006622, partial [Massospora cicadina]
MEYSKAIETKPYPVLVNYAYQFDPNQPTLSEPTFSPTSPTFAHYPPPPYPARFNHGYNTYSHSSGHLSPIRSPTYSFNTYPVDYQRLPTPNIQNSYHPTHSIATPLLPSADLFLQHPPRANAPLAYNEKLKFLHQNPQYLSGLAGQVSGNTGKVSRSIAAQLFTRDELTDRFPCTLCRQTFKRINGLKRHLMMHLHIKPYKCEVCGRGFCRIDVYKRHVQRARCYK